MFDDIIKEDYLKGLEKKGNTREEYNEFLKGIDYNLMGLHKCIIIMILGIGLLLIYFITVTSELIGNLIIAFLFLIYSPLFMMFLAQVYNAHYFLNKEIKIRENNIIDDDEE